MGCVKLKVAVVVTVSQRSVMVHTTVAVPPLHSVGIVASSASSETVGEQPPPTSSASVCETTQALKAALTADWSSK